jgi:hypothetical protein
MNQKSSLREVPHFVSGALTANTIAQRRLTKVLQASIDYPPQIRPACLPFIHKHPCGIGLARPF